MVSPIQKISYMEEMDKMGAYAWLRLTPRAPNTVKMWFEDAACYDLSPDLFEPSFEGSSEEEIIATNEAKMEQALPACSDCPVWHLCYSKAEESDFYYTMRAGLEPGQLKEYKELHQVRDFSGERVERCSRGHNDWVIWGKKRPRRKCRQCDLEDGPKRRQARRDRMEI